MRESGHTAPRALSGGSGPTWRQNPLIPARPRCPGPGLSLVPAPVDR
ncbi:MAG TPA: hypothetical protein VHJ83_07805 [Micromonosporaceae bacterium]|nr:hypothetical protein [Micromonosporaceae bacterium]